MDDNQEKLKLCEACSKQRNFFCTKHGDVVQRLIERLPNCEGWGNGSTPVVLRPESPVLQASEYNIDVFLPYHRNLYLVPETINSILAQHGVRCFIHLVNDCSNEDDSKLKQRYGHLENIAWYKTAHNCGPYAIANCLFYHTKTNYIGMVDSDDVYLPSHFETALNDIEETESDIWCSSMQQFLNPVQEHSQQSIDYVKRNPIIKSGILMQSIIAPRIINATMVIKRDIFEKLNGFEGTYFCGADTEFTQRLQMPNEIQPKIHTNDTVTALRRICDNSLSNSSGRYGFKSQERTTINEEIQERFVKWQAHSPIDVTLYGNLRTQDNVLYQVKVCNKRLGKVYACMTTIPRRLYALEKSIETLIDQVDGIKIHLNDFYFVPEFLKNPKIEIVFGTNELMSCTKFMWADKLDGYVLTCDDDLLYPADYVAKMVEAIDKYKCWVCAHGSKIDKGVIDNYYKNRRIYNAKLEVKEDTFIDVPGTGLSGFHTDDIKVSMAEMNLPGMEDIAAFRHLYNNSYRLVVIKHPHGWLKSATHKNDKGLWGDSILDGSKETRLINETRG